MSFRKRGELLFVGPNLTAVLRNAYPRFNRKVKRKFKKVVPFTEFTDLFADSVLLKAEELMHAKFKPIPKPRTRGISLEILR
jgi:hypothetical protein